MKSYRQYHHLKICPLIKVAQRFGSFCLVCCHERFIIGLSLSPQNKQIKSHEYIVCSKLSKPEAISSSLKKSKEQRINDRCRVSSVSGLTVPKGHTAVSQAVIGIAVCIFASCVWSSQKGSLALILLGTKKQLKNNNKCNNPKQTNKEEERRKPRKRYLAIDSI